ncbi:MAG: hypothetical protein ABII26_02660 [Pseudomonadota bacterium]
MAKKRLGIGGFVFIQSPRLPHIPEHTITLSLENFGKIGYLIIQSSTYTLSIKGFVKTGSDFSHIEMCKIGVIDDELEETDGDI